MFFFIENVAEIYEILIYLYTSSSSIRSFDSGYGTCKASYLTGTITLWFQFQFVVHGPIAP